MAELKAWLARIDALSLKERALLLGALVLLIVFACNEMLMQPLALREKTAGEDMAQRREAIAAVRQQAADVEARGKLDPDAETRARVEQVSKQIEETRQAIVANRPQLVPPGQMVEVLKTVLSRSANLTFVALNGLGVKPLHAGAVGSPVPASDAGEAQAAISGAYLHGMQLRFDGAYLDVLAYLRELEGLPWKFLWESVAYEVGEYPRGQASVVVYTLSLEPDWIGL